MTYSELAIPGVYEILPRRFGDERGYFCETFKSDEFKEHIGEIDFVQDNESVSKYGVLRGLHFQAGEFSQAKLVRVSRGEVLDVAVDLRLESPTFGKHVAVRLSAELGNMLFIPRHFAHGFVVLSDMAQFQYKVDNGYHPVSEHSIMWNDPDLAIDWIVPVADMLLSPKDLSGKQLKNINKSYL